MKIKKLTVVAAMVLLSTGPVLADPPPGKGNPGKGNQGQNGQPQHNQSRKGSSPELLDAVLANLLMAGVNQVYARNLAVSQGLTGFSALPPGIQKNLARGKPLPPGIAKKSVPGPMLAQLPQYRGYEWRITGTDLVLVNLATLVIAEVLHNVFD